LLGSWEGRAGRVAAAAGVGEEAAVVVVEITPSDLVELKQAYQLQLQTPNIPNFDMNIPHIYRNKWEIL
jgi:hypothetical protein